MITRLRVKNYRCFEDFDWRPEQICLLIGQNGTGKSTLFELLAGLREMLSGKRTVEKSGQSHFSDSRDWSRGSDRGRT